MQDSVIAAVRRNETWRGQQCINLLAPEAPTSPTVRALLASEIGTRAAEGHIGAVNRWFAGTRHIDEVEALCVELLKRAFRCRYADHRLAASMIVNLAVYTALTEPGDVIMSISQPFGSHSSNRWETIEVTRLGMGPAEMKAIADFMARVLVERESPETVGEDVIEFRQAFQTLYYNFDHCLPPR